MEQKLWGRQGLNDAKYSDEIAFDEGVRLTFEWEESKLLRESALNTARLAPTPEEQQEWHHCKLRVDSALARLGPAILIEDFHKAWKKASNNFSPVKESFEPEYMQSEAWSSDDLNHPEHPRWRARRLAGARAAPRTLRGNVRKRIG